MSLGRGDPVAPPPGDGEFAIIFASKEAARGWSELCRQVPGAAGRAWEQMRRDPAPSSPTERHHPLKAALATATHQGRELPVWQIEVTGGGRVWYLFDRERRTCWLKLASLRHPKKTE
ncbi:hypothetical protein [Streptomyces radicis]|uniref:Uncharacterized protein n=1 Tax=Streptomyces radicis TaxID=1750517 RepID=A0A3A9W8B6_9ACTN|nr:hypothetical protein [Streptomyces radicis]RKN08942.1 hypothetical protein D7319_13445 [Streptomyces radicis]RKN22866.1 hypothetical protein D7318_15110 [Streptomyces radicis]